MAKFDSWGTTRDGLRKMLKANAQNARAAGIGPQPAASPAGPAPAAAPAGPAPAAGAAPSAAEAAGKTLGQQAKDMLAKGTKATMEAWGKRPTVGDVGKVLKAGGGKLWAGGKVLVKGAAPLVATGAAIDAYGRPTEDYEKRFGYDTDSTEDMSPLRQLLQRDLPTRAMGVGTDVANAFTGGILGNRFYPDLEGKGDILTAAQQTKDMLSGGRDTAVTAETVPNELYTTLTGEPVTVDDIMKLPEALKNAQPGTTVVAPGEGDETLMAITDGQGGIGTVTGGGRNAGQNLSIGQYQQEVAQRMGLDPQQSADYNPAQQGSSLGFSIRDMAAINKNIAERNPGEVGGSVEQMDDIDPRSAKFQAAQAAIARGENVDLDALYGGGSQGSSIQKQIDKLEKNLSTPGRGLRQSYSDLMKEQSSRGNMRRQLKQLYRLREQEMQDESTMTNQQRLQKNADRDFALRLMQQQQTAGQQAKKDNLDSYLRLKGDAEKYAEGKYKDDPGMQAIDVANTLSKGMPEYDYSDGPGILARREATRTLFEAMRSEQWGRDWLYNKFGINGNRPISVFDVENISFKDIVEGPGEIPAMLGWLFDNRAIRQDGPGDNRYAYLKNLPAGHMYTIRALSRLDNPERYAKQKDEKKPLREQQ